MKNNMDYFKTMNEKDLDLTKTAVDWTDKAFRGNGDCAAIARTTGKTCKVVLRDGEDTSFLEGIHRSKSNRMIINCFLGFLIGRFDQRQRISYLCPSNSLCRMEKSLQTAINPVSTFGMVFVRSDRSGFLYQGPVGILYLVL